MKIFGRALKFGDPESADIVIVDETGSHLVRSALSGHHRVAVVNMRPEDIRLGFRIVLLLGKFLRQLKFSEAKVHPRGRLIGLLKQLRCIYIEASIAAMNPRAAVTYIDNCARFSWLSRNCRLFPFIAIQNGSRLSYAKDDNVGYYLQHFFSFGQHESLLFPKLGYQVENYYPVGSLVASLHIDASPSAAIEKYDLLIVSTWRGNIGFPKDVQDMMRSMKIMDDLLAAYIKSRGVRAAVILRAERNGEHWVIPELGIDEEEYYHRIYGDDVDLVDTDFSKRNIFPLMQRSHLIVSCLSSALVEAFGLGKKILYCNFTGTDLYHCDLDPAMVTRESSEADFYRRLDDMLHLPQEEYRRRHRSLVKHYMNFPDDLATHKIIARSIDRIIDEHKAIRK